MHRTGREELEMQETHGNARRRIAVAVSEDHALLPARSSRPVSSSSDISQYISSSIWAAFPANPSSAPVAESERSAAVVIPEMDQDV